MQGEKYLDFINNLSEKGNVDLDIILPPQILKVDDSNYQFEKKEQHMNFVK